MKTARMTFGVMFFVMTVAVLQAQAPDTLWTRMYGGALSEIAYCVQQTNDGGYVLAGDRSQSGSHDFCLLRTDAYGETMWERALDVCAGWDEIRLGADCVQSTEDGGFAVLGNGYVFHSPFYAWHFTVFTKTDSAGNILWEHHYTGSTDCGASSFQGTSDGGFIIAGAEWYTYFASSEPPDCYVIKTDGLGVHQWSIVYGDSMSEVAEFVQETDDGGYIIAGSKQDAVTFYADALLIKANAEGDILWVRTYGGEGTDEAKCLRQTLDGGYIMAGKTWSFGEGNSDVYVIRTDENGDTLWTRTCGGAADDYGNSVVLTVDDGYLVGGTTNSFGAGVDDMYLIKINDDGEILWTGTYGGFRSDKGFFAIQTSEGGYALAGASNLLGVGTSDMYLVKTWPEQPGNGPQIYVSDNYLNFGTVPCGGQAELPLTIHNFGNSPLIIHDVYSSHQDFVTTFDHSDSLIQSLSYLEIAVIFQPSDTMIFAETLLVESNDELVSAALVGMTEGYVAVNSEETSPVPSVCQLGPPYPNPFNSVVRIAYLSAGHERAKIRVYNVLGRQVATLADAFVSPGSYSVTWDARDLPSGIYFVRMEAGEFVQTRKVVLLK